jgi:putative ABC transport system permease protein
MVDPNFFEIFTLTFIDGDEKTALKEPNTIVITQDEAIKYFGDENPLNKVLLYGESGQQFRVTGVIEKVPNNSHFHFDLFITSAGVGYARNDNWTSSDYHTYILLSDKSTFKDFEAKLPPIVEKYMGAQIEREIGMPFAEFLEKGNELGLFVQPLADIHLYSDVASETEIEPSGDIKKVYIFGLVAIFMLIVACINFMNLSTATASKRAREVGIRKVLGSKKEQLVAQFLTESLITTIVATVLGFLIVIVMLPLFSDLSGKELPISYIFSYQVLTGILFLILFISLLAGSYPAFYISSFKPISALKSKFMGSGKGNGIRSGLVVLQFIISSGLILMTFVVGRQMKFIENKDVGYDKEQILVLRDTGFLGNNQIAFKNQISNDPRVQSISNSSYVPVGTTNESGSGIFVDQKFNRVISVYNVDEQYIPTMGMELKKGRNFSKEFGADSLNIVINETAANIFGFGDNAVGKILSRETPFGMENLRVIGVVKDFNFRTLHQKIDPLMMVYNPFGGLIVRAKVSDMSGLIESISTKWKSFKVSEPFSYSILDDSFNQAYLKERRMGIILQIFAILTIFVACLGLFGLVTFTAEQRFKEIGIRKTLGSTVTQIVSLLAKDFVKLVFISFLVSFPIGFYLMDQWLQDFAYRVDIPWWVFMLTALITVVIAFFTISYRSIRAANANPIESLRAE